MDEELMELLGEVEQEMTTMSTEITAEILKIAGADESSPFNHAIEIRRRDGNPDLYQTHTRTLTEHMQSERDT